MRNDSQYVLLGYCRRPHGIKGGFSLNLINREDSVLRDGLELLLVPEKTTSSLEKEGQTFLIDKISLGNKAIIFFQNISDRNTVEEMIPFAVHCKRDDFPNLSQGEFYLNDLIGLQVVDEIDRKVGQVVAVSDNGVQDILRIEGNETIELLFHDNFILEIDWGKKIIKVRLPEYM